MIRRACIVFVVWVEGRGSWYRVLSIEYPEAGVRYSMLVVQLLLGGCSCRLPFRQRAFNFPTAQPLNNVNLITMKKEAICLLFHC